MSACRGAALAAVLCSTACAEQRLEVVRGASCRARPEQAACASPTWPNEHSRSNSDAWLDAHADGLREMRPRVLVLNFHNPLPNAQMAEVVARQVDALAEGSRYHGYSDPDAPAFLAYDLTRIVDLRDPSPPSGWPYTSSSLVPLDENGAFDVAALFSDRYSALIGAEDPWRPGHTLGLCEQFERGLVNELWLAVGDVAAGREPTPMVECKARRDARGQRSAGSAVATVGKAVCERLPPCDVTLRIAHLSPLRGLGCDLYVRGWAIEGSIAAIPYLRDNAARYFNADLDTRYGAPVSDLADFCPGDGAPCVTYPTPTTLESVVEGRPLHIEGYGQGCGRVEFPPNAEAIRDFENPRAVISRCEHYGLRDGEDGEDTPSTYSYAVVADRADEFPDCAGAWQMYWRQNMPGLDSGALAEDGTPMKNWWPFLFF